MSAAPSETPDASLLVIAGAVIVLASSYATAHTGPLGIVAGPAIDVGVLPWLARGFRRSYRSPGAPLWALGLGICSLLPAVATWSSPDVGLLLTATDALPAIILAALGWRRPLARAARVGGLLALIALAASLALFASH